MKNVHTAIAKAVAAVILTSFAGFASAAATQNLDITASVTKICSFTSAATTLTFGALDPSAAVNVNGSNPTVKYNCTKGTPTPGVTVGTGLWTGNQMKDPVSNDLIAYTLTAAAAGPGVGFSGTGLGVTFTSQVLGASYVDKSAGSYSDTVVLTITY